MFDKQNNNTQKASPRVELSKSKLVFSHDFKSFLDC